MKHIFLLLTFLFCTLVSFSQNITTFNGIPIDGSYETVKEQLYQKGFVPKHINNREYFFGNYLYHNVNVYIDTISGKVFKLWVTDHDSYNAETIKENFNFLVDYFTYHPNYQCCGGDKINEDSVIDVNNKIYGAYFIQDNNSNNRVWFQIKSFDKYYFMMMSFENWKNFKR